MSSGISFTCDSCGREVFGCNIVNGMKFCAKCYQETFSNQQNKESSELLVNSLAEKDRQITELKKQLEEKDKTIQGLIETQKYLEKSASYQIFLDIQKENILLKMQLQSQPAEIVEKIKNYKGEYFEWKIGDKIYPAFKITEEDLDTILKECQK